MTNEECLNSHIVNLKEVARLFCMDCEERKREIAICQCAIEADLCPYIKSLNFAIEFLERIKEE
jgi:hypothetical protein